MRPTRAQPGRGGPSGVAAAGVSSAQGGIAAGVWTGELRTNDASVRLSPASGRNRPGSGGSLLGWPVASAPSLARRGRAPRLALVAETPVTGVGDVRAGNLVVPALGRIVEDD